MDMEKDEIWRGRTSATIAFLRVSSRRQKDNTSHETQENVIRAYCAEHRLDLIRVVKIVESAAASEKRKAYHAAQKEALSQGIRHFVFYVSDRESRNLTDNEANELLVRQDLMVIHYARDRQVIHSGSSDSEFMMRDFLAVQNKQYIRSLRVKVSDAMRTKAENGWFPGNHVPVGYVHEKLKDENGRDRKRGTIIVPDPIEKNVRQVQREYELRAAGLSLREIRKRIILEGFIPAERVRHYYVSGIEGRLKNRFYAGYFIWEGLEHRGKHELIIPPDLWSRVQETFSRKNVRRSPGIFGGGWIRCGVDNCGCVVTYDPKTKLLKNGDRKVFEYYRCNNGKRVHESMRGMTISEDKIWEQLGDALDRIDIDEDFGRYIAGRLNAIEKHARDKQRRQAAMHQDALTALETQEDQAYADLRAGILSDDQYRRLISRIRSQRADYNLELARAQDTVTASYMKTATRIIELAIHAKTIWETRTPYERREMMEMVLSNRTLEGQTLRYDLTKPFEKLAEMKKSRMAAPSGQLSNQLLLDFRQAIIDSVA